LAQETHDDYFAFSGTASTAAAGSVYNAAAGLRSKDTGTRLSFSYRDKGVRIGADTSTLKFHRNLYASQWFSNSTNFNTWQVTGEYDVASNFTVAAQYANNAAGTCELNGPISCSTVGLGGNLVGFGAKYNLDPKLCSVCLGGQGLCQLWRCHLLG
jgi:hypothetical protein